MSIGQRLLVIWVLLAGLASLQLSRGERVELEMKPADLIPIMLGDYESFVAMSLNCGFRQATNDGTLKAYYHRPALFTKRSSVPNIDINKEFDKILELFRNELFNRQNSHIKPAGEKRSEDESMVYLG